MKTYNGGKSGSGVYQQIINRIPPHNIYIEPFAGHIGIFRKIRRAPLSILNDKAPAIIKEIQSYLDHTKQPFNIDFFQGNLFEKPKANLVILRNNDYRSIINRFKDNGDAFIYCDPPYPMLTRRSQQRLYTFEWEGMQDQIDFLAVIRDVKCACMISSYPNDLYTECLQGWQRHTFTTRTRGGSATEIIYMNYPAPEILHDYKYLGSNRRHRLEIKRKVKRWRERLAIMPSEHRMALLSSIVNEYKNLSERLIKL